MMKLLSLDNIYLTLKLLKNYYKFVFKIYLSLLGSTNCNFLKKTHRSFSVSMRKLEVILKLNFYISWKNWKQFSNINKCLCIKVLQILVLKTTNTAILHNLSWHSSNILVKPTLNREPKESHLYSRNYIVLMVDHVTCSPWGPYNFFLYSPIIIVDPTLAWHLGGARFLNNFIDHIFSLY